MKGFSLLIARTLLASTMHLASLLITVLVICVWEVKTFNSTITSDFNETQMLQNDLLRLATTVTSWNTKSTFIRWVGMLIHYVKLEILQCTSARIPGCIIKKQPFSKTVVISHTQPQHVIHFN